MNPQFSSVVVALNAVIITLTDGQPRVLTVSLPEGAPLEGGASAVRGGGPLLLEALPTGPLDPEADRTLELALRRWVCAYTGFELGYVEQLYTFGDRDRVPPAKGGGQRVLSAAYLALVREHEPAEGLAARWRSIYRFFPWEDWRKGRPGVIDKRIAGELGRWIEAGGTAEDRRNRRVRAAVCFGLEGSPWDGERVLERYELLFELGLVAEGCRNGGEGQGSAAGGDGGLGLEMAFDHRRILATALGRIRAKIRYRPVVFELMPATFTLLHLQRAVEALAGVRLHKQNFRRLVAHGGLVEGTGLHEHGTGGRPAELFRFRREVLLERPAPGVGLPGARH